jgi:hypothetical protein
MSQDRRRFQMKPDTIVAHGRFDVLDMAETAMMRGALNPQ